MTARDAIKAALDTVEGVTGRTHEPANKAPGVGWPRLTGTTPDGVLCSPWRLAYDVFVLLPNNHPTASEDAVEGLLVPIAEALSEVGDVVEAAPYLIQFDDTQTVPGIRVQIITDAEEA